MNKFKILVLFLSLLLLNGCAKYVTDKTITDSSGNTIIPTVKEFEFTVTFRGNPAQNGNYDYYFIVSSENFRVISPARTPEAYFFAPGEAYDNLRLINAYYSGDLTKDLQNVYDDYFLTWERYVRYNSTDVFGVVSGPFLASANHTAFEPVNLGFGNLGSGTQIKFHISLPYDDIWFNILAVDENNVLRDSLDSNINFTYENGKVLEETHDASDSGINSGLDIISYTVRSYEY